MLAASPKAARSLLILCLLGLSVTSLRADVTLAAPFRNRVVLQCDKPVTVWGLAAPEENIEVQFKAQTKVTTADRRGQWKIKLDSLSASAEPAKLTVTGRNTITVNSVLVGEVWLCSGQSNMNFPLKSAQGAAHEIGEAKHPLIHYFEVKSAVADQPLEMAEGEWKVCGPDTAGEFTAVGYFFARELQRELGVPIGIIKSTLGGSPIESWMSAQALADNRAAALAAEEEWKPLAADFEKRNAEYQRQLAAWQLREAKARSSGQSAANPKPMPTQEKSDRKKPSGLYNGFIHPLAPLTIAGFLWYQGEGNAERPADYRVLFPAMIRQWRHAFQQQDLPFLFVQLPNYALPNDASGQKWAWFREEQTTVLSLSNVNMAVTIDVGDPGDIHPANKQEVGRRLALVALRKIHGREVEDSGPVYSGMERQGSAMQIHFTHASGLHFKGALTNAFLIAGSNRQFIPAEARIERETVVVFATGLSEPTAVRFAWANDPQGWLLNSQHLPATPFRTDNW